MLQRLEKVAIDDNSKRAEALEEIKHIITLARLMGVKRRIVITPWSMTMLNQLDFTGGLVFEAKGAKRTDIIARGGR